MGDRVSSTSEPSRQEKQRDFIDARNYQFKAAFPVPPCHQHGYDKFLIYHPVEALFATS